jgi:hypothetical protein
MVRSLSLKVAPLTSVPLTVTASTPYLHRTSLHLSSKAECDRLFTEVKRILAPGGQFIVMGPNIKYTYRVYWDYYDHILPFSDLAVAEGLSQHGFVIERRIGRFLPFTMNNAMPTPDIAIKVYLHLRIAWRVLGKQFLIVSRKPLQ